MHLQTRRSSSKPQNMCKVGKVFLYMIEHICDDLHALISWCSFFLSHALFFVASVYV